MAKSRTNKYTTSNRVVRDTAVIASSRLHYPSSPVRYSFTSLLPQPLYLVEDRRTFHPDGLFRSPVAQPRSAARIVAKKAKTYGGHYTFGIHGSSAVGFSRPGRVALCVKRKVRREVLLAIGRGGAGNRKGKRTYSSQFHCG